MNIYREVVKFFNSLQPGESFTTKQFHAHMAGLGYRDPYQANYRINTYRTYLGAAGFVDWVKNGHWVIVHPIPEWVTVKMLETARGYGRGCNKVVQRETQDKIAAYFHERTKESTRTWNYGDQFTIISDMVYTIEKSTVENQVVVMWTGRSGKIEHLHYKISEVDNYITKGSWKLIKKTNIQENVSPAQKDSVDLQETNERRTKTQTTMAKPTTLPVSPAFIVEAHRVACSDWKAKLEQMYPSVFQPTQTFKVGDKIQFPQSSEFSNATYILADTGKRHMVLINLQSGGRWTEQVVVANPSAITAEEMKKICYNQKLDTILVNGTTPTMATKWSKKKTLTAKVSDILAAHKATSEMTTKNMIKGYFPEAFSQYVKFVESSAGKVTLSPHTSTIDGADFIIGRGLAPRPELEGACIGVHADKVEVEVITSGKMTWVAFKKK